VSQPRSIAPADRERIYRTASVWADTGSFTALRTRALTLLAWGSGLRLNECCSLNVVQLLEREPANTKRWRLSSLAYLKTKQAKGRRVGTRQWTSAGTFVVTKPARHALRAYIRAARARGWMQWPPTPTTPLFLVSCGNGERAHSRLGRRAAQHCWHVLQRRALVVNLYRFHDLRHDALTRVAEVSGGDAFQVATFGRCDAKTALRYVHNRPSTLTDIAERAARRTVNARAYGQ
jgi:integrase